MSTRPTDPKKPATKAENKKTETVLLTPEELRRLAGGATNPSPSPNPKPDVIVKS